LVALRGNWRWRATDPYRCEAESAPIPATIRNSTLPLPAIPKMLPCSIRACPKILPAPWIGRSHYNILKSFGNSASEDRLSLQFLKISLQIGKLQGDGPRDRFASDCILSHAVRLRRVTYGVAPDWSRLAARLRIGQWRPCPSWGRGGPFEDARGQPSQPALLQLQKCCFFPQAPPKRVDLDQPVGT
jgi:hypothetical protein